MSVLDLGKVLYHVEGNVRINRGEAQKALVCWHGDECLRPYYKWYVTRIYVQNRYLNIDICEEVLQ